MTNEAYEQFLHVLRVECGCEDVGYDPLLEYLLILKPDHRILVQIFCIDKFKYEECCNIGGDMVREVAAFLWVDRGHAKRFFEVYDENLSMTETYERVMGRSPTGS